MRLLTKRGTMFIAFKPYTENKLMLNILRVDNIIR
jgi:hypothetical protein